MAAPKNQIIAYYNALRDLFNEDPLSANVTQTITTINNECVQELSKTSRHPLNPGNGNSQKHYFSFSNGVKFSRPVNAELYDKGCEISSLNPESPALPKYDIFFKQP